MPLLSGSAIPLSLKKESMVIVKTADDLRSIDPNKGYEIDGAIDIGDTPIVVPEGGINIKGQFTNKSKLFSSVSGTPIFTSPLGGYSGNIEIQLCTIYATGAGIFNVDNSGNFGAIDLTAVNLGDFGQSCSLGSITGYRQVFTTGCGFISLTDGLTCSGAMSGLAITDTIALIFSNTGTLFKRGASFSLTGSFRSNMNFLSTGADSKFCDFQEADIVNASSFTLDGFRTNATNPIPNIPSSSVKASYRYCQGLKNTYKGGQFVFPANATSPIALVSEWEKVTGATTYSELSHFVADGDNSIKYIGDDPIAVKATVQGSFSGSTNNQIEIGFNVYDDSATSYVGVSNPMRATLNGGLLGTRAEALAYVANLTLEKNDKIELWIRNLTMATSVETIQSTTVIVEERTT